MRTFSDYFSVIEHQNLLRMENRADPLCHDDHGAVFDILRQCFSKRRIRFQVKCRKTVVENKDFRVFCNRTRNRQTLFLSAGYVRSALCNRGFVFVIFASINSVACAIAAAFSISASVASSFPKRRLMRSFPRTAHLSAARNRSHRADPSS